MQDEALPARLKEGLDAALREPSSTPRKESGGSMPRKESAARKESLSTTPRKESAGKGPSLEDSTESKREAGLTTRNPSPSPSPGRVRVRSTNEDGSGPKRGSITVRKSSLGYREAKPSPIREDVVERRLSREKDVVEGELASIRQTTLAETKDPEKTVQQAAAGTDAHGQQEEFLVHMVGPIEDYREAQLEAQAVVADVTHQVTTLASSVVAEEMHVLQETKELEDQLAKDLKAEFDLLVEAEIEARAVIAAELPDDALELEAEIEERARTAEDRERQLREAMEDVDESLPEEERKIYREIAMRAWSADIAQSAEERLLLTEIAKRNQAAQIQEFNEQRRTEALIAWKNTQLQLKELELRVSTESEVEKRAALALLREAKERAKVELEIAERNKKAAEVAFEEKVQQQAIITAMMKRKAAALVQQPRVAATKWSGARARRRSSQVTPSDESSSGDFTALPSVSETSAGPSASGRRVHNTSITSLLALRSTTGSPSSEESKSRLVTYKRGSEIKNAALPENAAQIKQSRGSRLVALLKRNRKTSSSSGVGVPHMRSASMASGVQLHLYEGDTDDSTHQNTILESKEEGEKKEESPTRPPSAPRISSPSSTPTNAAGRLASPTHTPRQPP